MSSRNTIWALAVLVVAFGLAACGFRPLYGTDANAVSQQELSQVRIGPLEDRIGQLLHIRLTKAMHPRGQARKPVWLLSIDLKDTTQKLGIRKDETATRANMTLEARFNLSAIETGEVAFRGRSVITISYNILESRFGTVTSRANAERRATSELGDNIKNRVSLFLAARQQASAGR